MPAHARDDLSTAMEPRRSRAHRRKNVDDSRDVPDRRAARSPQTDVLRHALAVKSRKSMLDRVSRADNNGSSEVRRGESRNLHHYLLPLLHPGQEPAQEQKYRVR